MQYSDGSGKDMDMPSATSITLPYSYGRFANGTATITTIQQIASEELKFLGKTYQGRTIWFTVKGSGLF